MPCAHCHPPLLRLSLGAITAQNFQVLLLAALPAPTASEDTQADKAHTRQEGLRPVPIVFRCALSLLSLLFQDRALCPSSS